MYIYVYVCVYICMCLRYEFRLPLFTLPTGKSKPHLQSRTTYLEFRYREFQFTFPTIKFATRMDFNTLNTYIEEMQFEFVIRG